jgi:hypothetical protein
MSNILRLRIQHISNMSIMDLPANLDIRLETM